MKYENLVIKIYPRSWCFKTTNPIVPGYSYLIIEWYLINTHLGIYERSPHLAWKSAWIQILEETRIKLEL